VQITVSSDGGNVDVFSVEIEENPNLPSGSMYTLPSRIGIRFTEPIQFGLITITYEALIEE